jgi:hypothetical protein
MLKHPATKADMLTVFQYPCQLPRSVFPVPPAHTHSNKHDMHTNTPKPHPLQHRELYVTHTLSFLWHYPRTMLTKTYWNTCVVAAKERGFTHKHSLSLGFTSLSILVSLPPAPSPDCYCCGCGLPHIFLLYLSIVGIFCCQGVTQNKIANVTCFVNNRCRQTV